MVLKKKKCSLLIILIITRGSYVLSIFLWDTLYFRRDYYYCRGLSVSAAVATSRTRLRAPLTTRPPTSKSQTFSFFSLSFDVREYWAFFFFFPFPLALLLTLSLSHSLSLRTRNVKPYYYLHDTAYWRLTGRRRRERGGEGGRGRGVGSRRSMRSQRRRLPDVFRARNLLSV